MAPLTNAGWLDQLTCLSVHGVVMEAEVVTDGVRQVCRQDVRLEHVDVDADADGLAGADGAHGGYSRPPVVEDLPTANLSK